MSLNHIIKDIVPDDEKLDVKFGIVEADNLEVANVTLDNITCENLLVNNGVNLLGPLVSNDFIRTTEVMKAKSSLFKCSPFLNSTTIGPSQRLLANELVNGMAIFDDASKINFDYKMPYKIDLDTYLGLSGSEQYAFRFNVAIFANVPSGTTLRLTADDNPNSGISFNFAGTLVKALPHVAGEEDGYDFIGIRQTDGTYIIYG